MELRRKQKPKEKVDSQDNPQFLKDIHTWGDDLVMDDNWPHNMGRLRILAGNMNGVSHYNEMIEWEMILGYLYTMQVDIFCLSEINLNLYNIHIMDKIRELGRMRDRHLKLNLQSSKPVSRNAEYQPGGTILGVHGRWSGKIIYPKDIPNDQFGRWGCYHFQGKKNKIISIINVYRVCPNMDGVNTIALQQQRDIQAATGKLVNPRESLTQDIANLIASLHSKAHVVIVCGDINGV